MNDFYIGYLPQAPRGLARFLRRVIAALGVLTISIALALVMKQMRFANSVFEYGKMRDFEGTIATEPYPALLVERPGLAGPVSKYSQYLLVAPGKHVLCRARHSPLRPPQIVVCRRGSEPAL